MEKRLRLHEEVLLLALRDEEGTIEMGSRYAFALAGAILAELMLEMRLTIWREHKKVVARVINPRALGDLVLDDCLKQIGMSSELKAPHTWLARFARVSDLKHRVARRLCDLGILRAVDDKMLLVFNRKTYPEIDPQPERDLIERLRQAIFSDRLEIDPRTMVLIGITYCTDLLSNVLNEKEIKSREERILQFSSVEMQYGLTKEEHQSYQGKVAFIAAIIPNTISLAM